ncbi:hypothetical protein IWW50_000652 [Coemansia erecta]|nr:hypothetical protein IWW50_000652 [Coemansia erecta]
MRFACINSGLRCKVLKKIAQLWTTELVTQTRAFHTQVRMVPYWNRELVKHGTNITSLYKMTIGVEILNKHLSSLV